MTNAKLTVKLDLEQAHRLAVRAALRGPRRVAVALSTTKQTVVARPK